MGRAGARIRFLRCEVRWHDMIITETVSAMLFLDCISSFGNEFQCYQHILFATSRSCKMTYQALRITRILNKSRFSRVLFAPVVSRAYHISHKARVEIRSSGSLTYLIDTAWMLTRQPCPRLLTPQIVASYPHRIEGTWRGQLVCRGRHLRRAIVVLSWDSMRCHPTVVVVELRETRVFVW